ncbi:hypothetical protein L873DRAFT_1715801, partial [Choiromyces venosus 120613-1]
IMIFGHECRQLSTIFNDVCIYLYHLFTKKLYWDSDLLSSQCLEQYCIATTGKGEPTGHIWCFIDALFYSGHEKQYTIQFQAITIPDGLIASLSG